jgi:hypothetical protein
VVAAVVACGCMMMMMMMMIMTSLRVEAYIHFPTVDFRLRPTPDCPSWFETYSMVDCGLRPTPDCQQSGVRKKTLIVEKSRLYFLLSTFQYDL